MLLYPNLDLEKKAFIFELDNVLYPEQDYLLQVYYLFANLLEYVEHQPTANELTDFLKKTYLEEGSIRLFKKASDHFNIDSKYEESFNSMHVKGKLPLKLLLYKKTLSLISFLIGENKSVFILTKGNPFIQYNKIKHINWHGLENHIKSYFYDEIILKSELRPLEYILLENNIVPGEALFLGLSNDQEMIIENTKVDFADINLYLK